MVGERHLLLICHNDYYSLIINFGQETKLQRKNHERRVSSPCNPVALLMFFMGPLVDSRIKTLDVGILLVFMGHEHTFCSYLWTHNVKYELLGNQHLQ